MIVNALLHEGEHVYYRTLADLAELILRSLYYDLRLLPKEDTHYGRFNPISDVLMDQIGSLKYIEGIKMDPESESRGHKMFLVHQEFRQWMNQLSRMSGYADVQEDAKQVIRDLKKLYGRDWHNILQNMVKDVTSKGKTVYEAKKSSEAFQQIKALVTEGLGLSIYITAAKPIVSPLLDFIHGKIKGLSIRRARYREPQMDLLERLTEEPCKQITSVTGVCLDCHRIQTADNKIIELSLCFGDRSVAIRTFDEGWNVEAENMKSHSLEVIGTSIMRKGFLTLIPLEIIDKGKCSPAILEEM